ncbi:MAG: LamG-like jellyroll fold domain-containing protein, partial [Azospirillaceae bacterium]
DGANVTLYSNGVAVLTAAWTLGAVNAGDLLIGRDVQGHHFDGEMADLRIWNTDLSQSALQHLMRQDTARDHSGLVADYDFGGSGATLADAAGTAQDGILQNGAAWVNATSLSVSRGEEYRGLLLASDIDLDPAAANLTYSLSSAASHGTVTLNGNTFTYVNDGTNNAADSFQVTISDGSATRVETVNVSVNTGNRAPTAPALKAIRFDGVNDYITFADSGVLERGNSGELTAQAWIKLDTVAGHVPIFDKPQSADSNASNWRFEVVDGLLRLWSSGGGSVDQTGGPTLQAGTWYNIAISRSSGGSVTLYLDGVNVGGASNWNFGPTNSGPFYIGRDGAGRYMDGEIAQVRIWQDRLSSNEIQNGMSRKAIDSISQLWAHFNLDGSGTTVIDQGGGVAQNGTLKNGASRVDLVDVGIENDASYSGIVLGDEPDANIRSQSLSYSLASQPQHGTVTLTGNKFVYDHAGDGQNDSFDVFISDGTAVTRQTIDITIVNNTAPVVAESNSLSFDGTDDFVTVSHDAALSFGSGNAFALDLWVKPDDIAGNTVLLDKAGSLVSQSNYRLELDQGGVRIWSWDNAGAVSELLVANAGVVAGAWNHIAFGYDGSGTGHLYLNGVEIGSGSWTPQYASGDPLLLGKAVDGRFFGGELGDLRVWNRQLSVNEIQNLMSQEARTDLSGLVLDLDFGGAGNTISDDAGTAQNGTLNGAARVSSTSIDVVRDGSYRGLVLGNDAETTPLAGQLNYAVSSGPSNGTVTFDGNRFVYQHDGSSTSSDSFTVSISDGSATASQVITVTVDSSVAAPSFKPANALVLDGVDDYVTTPDMSALDRSGTEPLTLEAWIKADTLDGHFTLFDKSPDLNTDNANYRLEIIDGALKLYSNGGIDFRQTVGTVSAGEWHHVAATYDGSGNAALYLDGALVGSTSAWSYSGAENAGALVIGRDSSAGGRHFDGQVAEARYWTAALTQSEIQAAMTRAASDADLPLAVRYDFGGTGTTVTDDAGNTAQNGTLMNGAARSDLLAIAVQNDAVYRGILLADDFDSTASATALSYEIAGKPTHGSLSLDGNRFTYDHVGDGRNDSFAIWVSDGTNRSLKTFAVSTTNATPQLAETSIVNLDGIDDYLSVADHDDLDFTGGDAFSLEMWINPDDIAGTTVLMDKLWGGGGNETSYRLELDDGGIRLYNDNGSGGVSNIYADTKGITAGRWHHLVASYDGSGTARIYIDGALATSGSYANVQAGNAELYIGRAQDGRYYDGQIGDVRIWSKALGLDEIRNLKTQDTAGDTANLVLDLDFTGSGSTVTDDAGTAQNATLTNGAARLATGSAVTVTNDGVHYGLLLAQDNDINPLAYGLSYSITLTPEHGTVSLDGNRFTYDHSGDGQNDSFEVTISDGAASVSQTVNVTVNGANTPPGLSAMHAIVFDGVDDHISVADHADLDFGATDPITLEAWVYFDSVTGEHNIFDKTDDSAGFANNFRLYVRDGVLGFHNGNQPLLESGAIVSAGEWTHVAMTYDGTTMRLFKDGAEAVNGARQLGSTTDTPLTVGRDELGRFFDGQMTEIRIWDKALSQAELQAGMTRKVDQSTANLVLQFDGDSIAGGQVADGSGNGHAGTLNNGAHQADLKAVQISNNSVYKGLLLGTDGQGTAISAGLDYHLAKAPEHGTLSMSGNAFTYDHDGSGADDSFQVAIDDGSATSYHDVTFTVA